MRQPYTRSLRRALGLYLLATGQTQQQTAAQLQISQGYLSLLLSGRRRPSGLMRGRVVDLLRRWLPYLPSEQEAEYLVDPEEGIR